MPDGYPVPNESPFNDIDDYIGVLLGVIEDFLEFDSQWDGDYSVADARLEDLKLYIALLENPPCVRCVTWLNKADTPGEWHPQRRNLTLSGQDMTRNVFENWRSDNLTSVYRGITLNLTVNCEITEVRLKGAWTDNDQKALAIYIHRPGDPDDTWITIASDFTNAGDPAPPELVWTGSEIVDAVSFGIRGIEQEIIETRINCE